ncbi:MAG: molybdopterin dinucleotide-binding protein [Candidatus Lokiarchaeota archaeon]|nr:molybdopterin dinucleotide-binding protein [Candidatus Lokiarchaeota archaeon]
MTSLKLILMSGRTIDQGLSLEGGKLSHEAMAATGVAFLDPEDMKSLNILSGTSVRVKTSHGEVIVKARTSPDAPHKGIVFIPMGIYANRVIDPETFSTGMPQFKNCDAEVEVAETERVLTPSEMALSYMS